MDFDSMDRLMEDRSLGIVTVLLLAEGGYAPVNTRRWIGGWNPRLALLSATEGDELAGRTRRRWRRWRDTSFYGQT
jgi:hypothetical protein